MLCIPTEYLHYAAFKGNNKVITFLIDHGAEVNAINNVSYHHNITIGVATLNDNNINDYNNYFSNYHIQ